MKVKFTLKGETPLLMHADDVLEADMLKEWRSDPAHKNISVPGDDRSPAWTWQTYLYGDGANLALPSENLMVCLRQAGAKMILKRNTTYKEVTQSGMVIDSEFCRLLVHDREISLKDINAMHDDKFADQCKKVMELGFRLFVKRAKVGQSKHVRVRARFESWTVSGNVEVFVPEITYDVLTQLFALAGRVGLCDWRPGCRTPGPYGMFSAQLEKVG